MLKRCWKGGVGMYIKKTWISGRVIEIEKTYTARYKGKKTIRAPKTKKTNEIYPREYSKIIKDSKNTK